MCANLDAKNQDLKSVGGVQYDGDPQTIACAPNELGNSNVTENNGSGDETVFKKRKTRRGKPKRRFPNPYIKPTWQQRKNMNSRQAQQLNRFRRRPKIMAAQAFAPYNSNQFLMEDHGNLQELDDKLNQTDKAAAGSSLVPRTRDSSFSVDSDADFYSSPEGEEEFLTKEFDNCYEDAHADRLHSLTKDELIEEYLQLESRMNALTDRFHCKNTNTENKDENVSSSLPSEAIIQQEMNRLLEENEDLRRENEILRNGVCRSGTPLSSSVDSESDSSSSTCNSSSSTDHNEVKDTEMSPSSVNHAETNGFSPHQKSPNVA